MKTLTYRMSHPHPCRSPPCSACQAQWHDRLRCCTTGHAIEDGFENLARTHDWVAYPSQRKLPCFPLLPLPSSTPALPSFFDRLVQVSVCLGMQLTGRVHWIDAIQIPEYRSASVMINRSSLGAPPCSSLRMPLAASPSSHTVGSGH